MPENKPNQRIHPLVAAAAAALIVVSLVGVAAITGILPTSNSKPQTEAEIASMAAASNAASSTVSSTTPPKALAEPTLPVRKAQPAVRPKVNYEPAPAKVVQAPICDSCGVVESIRAIEQPAAQGSGVGAVAGALLGGVLGNQVGGGDGRKLATVAGAVAGGYGGNAIEKRNNTHVTYEVRVRMENGNSRTFNRSNQPAWREGDHVRVVDGNLVSD